MAILRHGKCNTRNFSAPYRGYLFQEGNTEGCSGQAVQCKGDRIIATVGLGIRDWDSPKEHHHGYPGIGWDVRNGKIDQVIAYALALVVKVTSSKPANFQDSKYTVAIGANSRSQVDVHSGRGRLTAISHERHQKLRTDGGWTTLSAHTMSAITLQFSF